MQRTNRAAMMAGAVVVALAGLAGCQQAPKADAAGGGGTEAKVAAGKPVNAKCAIMHESRVNPNITAEWKGQTVGFCCGGCKGKWARLSEAEKAEELAESMQTKSR